MACATATAEMTRSSIFFNEVPLQPQRRFFLDGRPPLSLSLSLSLSWLVVTAKRIYGVCLGMRAESIPDVEVQSALSRRAGKRQKWIAVSCGAPIATHGVFVAVVAITTRMDRDFSSNTAPV
jgi:hypothetical protein